MVYVRVDREAKGRREGKKGYNGRAGGSIHRDKELGKKNLVRRKN